MKNYLTAEEMTRLNESEQRVLQTFFNENQPQFFKNIQIGSGMIDPESYRPFRRVTIDYYPDFYSRDPKEVREAELTTLGEQFFKAFEEANNARIANQA